MPLSLTASDGTGLELLSLTASAVVEGPLAFTELHLVFQNPKEIQIEGRFAITLPVDAAISRFAMLLPWGWQEAEVVERHAARRAYEDFLHRRQDPALLEHAAGNEFSARVFPIPAYGRKEIKLSYSQELRAADGAYRLPLRGLPAMERLDIMAIAGNQVVKVTKTHHQPTQDFQVLPQRQAAGLRSDNLVVARARPRFLGGADPIQSVLILLDTSASRAAGFTSTVALTGVLIHEMRVLGSEVPLQVACYDQSVEPVFTGTVGQFSTKELERIMSRGPLGASDLGGALRWAAGQKGYRRLVLITDGVITAGETGAALRQAVAALAPRVERLDAVVVGGIRDEAALRPLLAGNLARDGALIVSAQQVGQILQRLGRATHSGVQVAVPGARWVWPAKLDSLQEGDEVLVYADMGGPAPDEVTVSFSGPLSSEQQVPLALVERPLLERSFMKARIASLAEQEADLSAKETERAAALRTEVVALSRRFRVLSDHTALLVLETAQDYARFGIDRRALADILVVGDRGLDVLQRTASVIHDSGGGSGGGNAGSRSDGRDLLVRAAPARRGAPEALEDQPRQTGVLGGGEAASPQGQPAALGRDAEEALSGLIGEAYGVGGLGLADVGGGGGTGESTIGLGNLGTIGRGGGTAFVGDGRAMRVRRAAAPAVVSGTAEVRGALDKEIIRRVIRRHLNELKFCYERELTRNPNLQGRITLHFAIGVEGKVQSSATQFSTLRNAAVEQCVASAARRWEFPRPQGGIVEVSYPFVLKIDEDGEVPSQASQTPREPGRESAEWHKDARPAYTGKMLDVMDLLKRGNRDGAQRLASRWHRDEPGDVMALIALGEALEATKDSARAARAYGSIIDLFPARADLRRFAGERLERLGDVGQRLATDTFRKAVEQRPDHPNSHRLLAYALLRQGQLEAAFVALEAGLRQSYPQQRFRGVEQILREDLGLVGAAWARVAPLRRKELEQRTEQLGAALAEKPSLRFVMSWETDANDVDFHIHDGSGGHAFFGSTHLPSGGDLYADVTTGYGPECFTIEGKPQAFPYRLEAHYYSRGPMGYGMGKLEVLQHDGRGNLKFSQRPFVVMNDQAFVDLGQLKGPL